MLEIIRLPSTSRVCRCHEQRSLAGDDRPLHEDFAHLAGRRLLSLMVDLGLLVGCGARFLESVCKQHIHAFILNQTRKIHI